MKNNPQEDPAHPGGGFNTILLVVAKLLAKALILKEWGIYRHFGISVGYNLH